MTTRRKANVVAIDFSFFGREGVVKEKLEMIGIHRVF